MRIASNIALVLIAWLVDNESGGPTAVRALQLLLARDPIPWIGRRGRNRTQVDQETVERMVHAVTLV